MNIIVPDGEPVRGQMALSPRTVWSSALVIISDRNTVVVKTAFFTRCDRRCTWWLSLKKTVLEADVRSLKLFTQGTSVGNADARPWSLLWRGCRVATPSSAVPLESIKT